MRSYHLLDTDEVRQTYLVKTHYIWINLFACVVRNKWGINGADGHNENNNVNRNSVIIQPKLYHRSHKVNRPGCLTYRW